jgi:hypothetical protein
MKQPLIQIKQSLKISQDRQKIYVNRKKTPREFKIGDHVYLMYSHLSMARGSATNHCKPQGTHKTLGRISKINELKSMERDLLKGEH